MSIVELFKVKQYLRIDGVYDDELIKTLIASAEAYVDGAVTDLDDKLKDDKLKALAQLAVMMHVKESYDNRDGRESKIPANLSRLLTQLNYAGGDAGVH